ncbi:hypothetical protein CAPTEDRAFT_137514, partial [Capitella teleta]
VSFLQMREANELVDVTLVFGDRRLACHKLILAGMCKYFHRMFLTDMVESYSKEIVMKDINASTGVLLIDYFYTQQIDITTHNAQDLLEASDMLLIDTLKRSVEEFFCELTDKSNCISLLNLARFYDLKMLREKAQDTVCNIQVDGMDDIEDMHLLEENDLVTILKASDVLDDSFCLVQKWILAVERSNAFDSLLQLLKKKMLHNKHGMELIQHLTQLYLVNDRPEKPSLMVGTFEGEMWQSIHSETWQPIQKPRNLNEVYSACAHPDGRLIISGGVFMNTIQSDCHYYDAHTAQWNHLPPMPTVRAQHSSIYHDHHVYVIGGNDGRSFLHSVDALDMRSLEWSSLPHMPQPLQCSYVVSVSDTLFVLGGMRDGWVDWSVDVHQYDSTGKTWHQRSPMPEQCAGGAAVALGDQVYVVGGWNKSCMKFNPQIDSWVSLQRPQFSHWYGPALVWNGCVLVCGGSEEDSIEEYSPLTDKWRTWTMTLPQKQELRFAFRILL